MLDAFSCDEFADALAFVVTPARPGKYFSTQVTLNL